MKRFFVIFMILMVVPVTSLAGGRKPTYLPVFKSFEPSTVLLNPEPMMTYFNQVEGLVADGAAAGTPKPVLGGGVDAGGNAQVFKTTSNGAIYTYSDSALSDTIDTVATGASAAVTGTDAYKATAGGTNGALTNTDVAVKTSAGRLYSLSLANTNASVVWIHFYDELVANVNVGTTQPKASFPLRASDVTHLMFNPPVQFVSGITVAVTTSDNHTTSTAPGTALSGTITYK